MHKEFEVIGNEVIVSNGWDNKVRACYNNIEEVLITENNIEEINNLINREKSYNKLDKSKLFPGYMYLSCSGIQTLTGILHLIQSNNVGILHLVCGTCFLFSGCSLTIPSRKDIKAAKQKEKLLEEELFKEELKLCKLNNNKSNDAMFIANGIKKISESDEIKDLRDKLQAIQCFNHYKHKYIRYYKKGILKEKLGNCFYNENEIAHIEELVKDKVKNKKKVKRL